ncbi:hypothetical protein VP14_207 [Vibrio phage VPMCC14]|nr:hypothetical protein VP14_207 [Vibrio phage VPMCC14]
MQYIKEKIHEIFSREFINDINKKGGFFIAGGFFTSLVTRKEINDVDIFFTNKGSISEFIRWMKDEDAWCSFISEKSLNYCYQDYKIQLIHYDYYDNLSDVFESFDFTINCAGWDSRTDEIEMDGNFLVHNSQRYLHFNPKTKFPLISALRVQKMTQRGYYIPKNQFVKIMLAVSQLKLESWEDFKGHCGSLYGLNYVTNETIGAKEFNIENALEVLENTSFDGNNIMEFRIDPSVVDFVLSGEEVIYVKLPDGKIKCVSDCEDNHILAEMIKQGGLKSKQVTVKDYLGEYVYKWVTSSLKSHYDSNYVYELGKDAVPTSKSTSFWSGGAGKLYFSTLNGLEYATYYNQGVILKCKYEEEDIIDIDSSSQLTLKKVVPVEVIKSLEDLK